MLGTYVETAQNTRATELLDALRAGGHQLDDCHVPLNESGGRHRHLSGAATMLLHLMRMLAAWCGVARKYLRAPRPDLIVVPYPSHLDVLLARVLSAGRIPVIMDAFLGLYDTVVDDRALLQPGKLPARALRALEHLSLRSADRVLLDTACQCDMLAHSYDLEPARFLPVPLAVDEALWHPGPHAERNEHLQIVFWGTFIPLHGIETIVAAARILQSRNAPVAIRLFGWGQTAPEIARELEKDTPALLDWDRRIVAPSVLADAVRHCDCVLGIFGTSAKARRVVPYKVYQGMASARCIISADTPAIREFLDDERNALLIPPGDPDALAHAVLRLCEDRKFCERLGHAARATFEERMSHAQIVDRLSGCISSLLQIRALQ